MAYISVTSSSSVTIGTRVGACCAGSYMSAPPIILAAPHLGLIRRKVRIVLANKEEVDSSLS